MAEVTVSPKFQIVIPKEIRESMGIAPCVRLVVTLIKSSFIEQRAREE